MKNLTYVLCKTAIAFMLNVFLFVNLIQAQIPAFPGAEGFGANTPGGRGGTVYKVINLKDRGPGSLREACEESGPRIVVFETGGLIALTDRIRITDPYLTIAGQTAPGDGICTKGAPISIRTHDVIIRGLRIRTGDENNGFETDRNGLQIGSSSEATYNIIIDHVSISWGVDEQAQQWYDNMFDVTWQWCIISEQLHRSIHSEGPHCTGHLIGDHARRTSVHHNLYAHNQYRNPTKKGDTSGEEINNVVYDWGWDGSRFQNAENTGPVFWNLISNYFKAGVNSDTRRAIRIEDDIPATSRIYVQGNIGPRRKKDTLPEWDIVWGDQSLQSPALIDSVYTGTITTQSAFDVYDIVADYAGAVPRDVIDTRIVSEVRNGTGTFVDCVDSATCDPTDIRVAENGWPAYAPGIPLKDSDNDGMPDDWENEQGLDINKNDSAEDKDGNGYTNIEDYINSLIPVYDPNSSGILEPSDIKPSEYSLVNYPNPFNPSTKIQYTLTRPERVKLTVYNIQGNAISILINGLQNAGKHSILWEAAYSSGQQLPSGAYFCRLEAGLVIKTIKMMFVR